MHHPGPPRFLATGERTELAPRDPDPDAAYAWRVADAPPDSEATVGDDPVTEFTPDVPGRYLLGLDAPDGDHLLTVRAFPASYEGVDVAGGSGTAIRDRDAGDVDAPVDYAARERHEGVGKPRVRVDASVASGDDAGRRGEAVFTAVPSPNPESSLDADDLAVTFVVDDRDVADAVAAGRANPRDALRVTGEGRELRVPLDAVPERLRVHAVAVARDPGEDPRVSVADAAAVKRVGSSPSALDDAAEGEAVLTPDTPEFETVRLNEPPGWTREASVYEVFVRTFADAEEGEGFDAIAERIPRIAELGVDTLWLTPVLGHDGKQHGYNIVDFFDTADDLGEREDFEALVETAHDHGMRVLFDFVANHTARDHEWFRDAYQNPDSPFRDRYEWQESGEPGTYFDWELIANLNHANLDVRRFLLDVIDEWAPLVDGFRCDMAWAVPDSFWRELRDRVKDIDREFLLMDETIPYIPGFHEGMFDVHFDATLYFQLRQVGRGAEPASTVLDAVDQRAEIGFPDHAEFLQYIENHDETRYRVECGDAAAAAAGAAIMTLPGVPMVYAGQEIGQRGRRDAIAWDHAREEVRDRYERLLETRREHPALGPEGDLSRVGYHVASGDLSERPIVASGDVHPDDVVAFRRQDGEEDLVVVLNFAPADASVAVEVDHGERDVVTGERCIVEDGEGTERLRVDEVAVVRVVGE
ncbi:alpha amylase catalytic region [Halorubrum distributum JCM 13561]|uniref:Alpha amylase catalytic region n=1 Tax=Halorubrum distributum JCM 13561 TaxID=1227483 RepID=M0P4L4_9EURY|nr:MULTISPECIES: alpha-amylase MalA [Halorubrum distributum group]EMA64763.1 alpha amylase catalytic region [Halorubrum litoreum JCM 13561]MDV7349601.1 alpha-amylase MalA [Halorubrum distributum]